MKHLIFIILISLINLLRQFLAKAVTWKINLLFSVQLYRQDLGKRPNPEIHMMKLKNTFEAIAL